MNLPIAAAAAAVAATAAAAAAAVLLRRQAAGGGRRAGGVRRLAAGNYAADLESMMVCKKKGFHFLKKLYRFKAVTISPGQGVLVE